MINTVHSLFKSTLEIVYPSRCAGCGLTGSILCNDCITSFRQVDPSASCQVCGRWLDSRRVCGGCMLNRYPFEEGYYGFYFEGSLREAIHAFKFKGRKEVGRYLVKFIADKIGSISERFDVIIPVPVTEKRLKERGFNQSFIIADEIGRITGRPVYPSILYKRRDTEDQFLLGKDKRRTNLKGAFAVKDKDRIKGKKVLVVDDLFTTGATAKEATGVILKSGVTGVIFFALARTP